MSIDPEPPVHYHIIGGDGATYGPAEADEVRQWVQDGRADGNTQVRSEGSTEWRPLREWPEFLEHLVPPSGAGDQRGVDSEVEPQIPAWLGREPELSPLACLGRGWQLLRSNLALLIGAAALNGIAQLGAALIPAGQLILGGVLMGGLFALFLKCLRGQPATLGDAFLGFSSSFLPLMIAGVVMELVTPLALACFLVPGVYLLVAWQFSLPLVIDRGIGWWRAMEWSRRMAGRVWWPLLALLVLANLPSMISFALLIRALMTELGTAGTLGQLDFPAIAAAVERAQGPSILHAMVSLLNLPFSTAAIACAYETLFGDRPEETH
jgi:hypothetical protein